MNRHREFPKRLDFLCDSGRFPFTIVFNEIRQWDNFH